MADSSTVARPYAKALFDLANAERKLPAWSAALGAAAAVVGDESAKRALANPALDDRRARRARRLGGRRDQRRRSCSRAPQGKNLLQLLAENDRLTALPEIAAQFDALKAEAENKVKVTVTAATAGRRRARRADQEGARAEARAHGGAHAGGRRFAHRRRDHPSGRHGNRRLGAHALAAAHREDSSA